MDNCDVIGVHYGRESSIVIVRIGTSHTSPVKAFGSKNMRSYMGETRSGAVGVGIAVFLALIAEPSACCARWRVQERTDRADCCFPAAGRRRAWNSCRVCGTYPSPLQPATCRGALPACNYDACAQAFRSFRSSDCSFQPFDGPRRVCEVGRIPSHRKCVSRGSPAHGRRQSEQSDRCVKSDPFL